MRKPDKPGSYRIVPKAGALMLTGVRASGERIKIRGLSREEAEGMAAKLFPLPPLAQPQRPAGQPSEPLDDFGLPPLKVSPAVVASVAPTGQSTDQAVQPNGSIIKQPTDPAAQADSKAKKAKQAQSLMEMVGMGWAAGTVAMSRRLTLRVSDAPVNPSPRQVNSLADSTKETLVEWFGDREIKPWQMMIMLTAAIPISMLIQSPKKKPQVEGAKSTTDDPSAKPSGQPLRSV